MRRILVPVDGSPSADRAVQHLALKVLHLVDIPVTLGK